MSGGPTSGPPLRRRDLLRAIEASVDARGLTLWSLGGAGWTICGDGTVIYVDPFFRGRALTPGWTCMLPRLFDPDAIRRTDAILFTHEHGDHCDETVIAPVARNTAAPFVGPDPCIDRVRVWGVPEARLRSLRWNESIHAGRAVVQALESCDPNAAQPNSYLIELGGHRVLHAGDSLPFPGLAEIRTRWRPEIGMLSVGVNPPGRRYYLTPEEMIDVTHVLGLDHLLPMHWNTWQETALDPERITDAARRISSHTRIHILHPGASCTFPSACGA